MRRSGAIILAVSSLVVFSVLSILAWRLIPTLSISTMRIYFLVFTIIISVLIAVVLFLIPLTQSDAKLLHMAYHDPLTGVANRNKLEQYLNDLLLSSRRKDERFAIILLDLDHFKAINDTVGHDAGDTLLQIVAERLKNTVRVTDIVARLGGDEFMIVITDVKRADSVAQVAQKIINNILEVFMIQGHEIYVTTSMGICVYPYDGNDIQALIKNADLALYRAKELGRNTYQFCTHEMTRNAQEKVARQQALSHALIKNEFLLHYQPAVDSVTGKITAVEALLRWQSKEYGLVTPDQIINLAEENNLILPLSEWVLRTACLQMLEWHLLGFTSLAVSINVSLKQFKQNEFINSIIRILAETKFPPKNLVLEITEGLIMHHPEKAAIILNSLNEIGVGVAIDNFGTGYSSFNYLKDFAVDKVKIDKTFIRLVTSDASHLAIVGAMIAVAKKLGIKAVAEGVESKEQFDALVKEGCTELQGYYISQPLTNEGMREYLQNYPVRNLIR